VSCWRSCRIECAGSVVGAASLIHLACNCPRVRHRTQVPELVGADHRADRLDPLADCTSSVNVQSASFGPHSRPRSRRRPQRAPEPWGLTPFRVTNDVTPSPLPVATRGQFSGVADTGTDRARVTRPQRRSPGQTIASARGAPPEPEAAKPPDQSRRARGRCTPWVRSTRQRQR